MREYSHSSVLNTNKSAVIRTSKINQDVHKIVLLQAHLVYTHYTPQTEYELQILLIFLDEILLNY